MTNEMKAMLAPFDVITFPCGSSYTNPGRSDYRDTDLLVYAAGVNDLASVDDVVEVNNLASVDNVVEHLVDNYGGVVGGNMHTSYDSAYFINVKVGKMDFIITHDYSFYEKFVLASETARVLQLEDKEQRIKLFKAILYGVFKWSG
jgi:hypothetical protein